MTAYVVDTLADTVAADGRVSLREAILAANGNARVNEAAAGAGGGVVDSITFAAGIASGTIRTVSELAISDRLTISGPATVSGELAHRVFRIETGAAVSMYGLTIQAGGGRYVSGDRTPEGAGIFNVGALSLSQCLFVGNEAYALGGAIFNAEAGSLAVAGCGFRGNGSLDRGGAIYNVGLLSVADSGFTDNYGVGGGVYNVGTATIARSVSRGDGGLFNAGAMTIEGGTVTEGSGVGNTGTMTLAGVTVSKNLTGGVTNNGGTLRVSGGLISENGGTGLYNSGDADVYGCVIFGNATSGQSGLPRWSNRGGGVYNGGNERGEGTLRLRDCVISQNAGRAGGGVYNWRAGVLTVSNCLITGNAAAFDTPYADPEDNAGGGIWNIGTLTVLGSVVSGNAAAVRGGGVFNVSKFVSANSRFADNTAAESGGGLFNGNGSDLRLDQCSVAGNAAAYGGGLFQNYSSGYLEVLRSTVSGNSATYGGGIAVLYSTRATGAVGIAHSTVSGNYASQLGGGVYRKEVESGGVFSPFMAFSNATVFGNRAGAAGGGLHGAASLQNTIVAGNRRGPAGTFGTQDDVTGSAQGNHSLIGDAATAGGLVNGVNANVVGVDWRTVLDPVLRNNGGPTLTHALIAGSPAIDAGSGTPLLPTDQRGAGFPRVIGAAVDIGAFEFGAGTASSSNGESLAAFWSRAEEEEAFAGLVAAV